jgi:transcriptional regulator of arginine metabolism
MPQSPQIQIDRREAIRSILKAGPAGTQKSLVDALTALGFEATQSSVSRDLKEIGAIKTADGYMLVNGGGVEEDPLARVSNLVREVQAAGPNLLVIKTAIGGAQRVALALDRSDWPEMVGNIGGDDTVFVATRTAAAQRNLVSRIEQAVARA